MARKLQYSDLGESDKRMYDNAMSSLQNKYEELYHLVNFPPLRLWANRKEAEQYLAELVEAYSTEMKQPVDTFLTDRHKPLVEFQKQHSQTIKKAFRFSNATNKNMVVALDLYASENPQENVDDEDYMRPEMTPW